MREGFNLDHWALQWFMDLGIAEGIAAGLTLTLDLIILIVANLLVDWLGRKIILRVVSRIVKRSKNDWDDVFLEKRVFNGLAHILPAAVTYYSMPYILDDMTSWLPTINLFLGIYVIVVVMLVVHRFLKSLELIAYKLAYFEGKPVGSFIQLFSIVNYIVGSVFILSQLVGKTPLTILGAFGAATAVLLLIFRDTILGLVASIQISINDMVRIGDWVTMEKYGADGDVVEINLTTVKIRNWDKTISTVPTYAFISDSFKNWRGMQSVGVRRIKRSIYIDLASVRFCDEALLERLGKIELIKGYLHTRQEEINNYNLKHKFDRSERINGRNMTNLGVFRKYAEEYLRKNPNISKEDTLMVRQLEPGAQGLPLEIYCFSLDIQWVNYEQIQSDLFDHLLAAIKHFDLRLFQNPTGSDFSRLSKN